MAASPNAPSLSSSTRRPHRSGRRRAEGRPSWRALRSQLPRRALGPTATWRPNGGCGSTTGSSQRSGSSTSTRRPRACACWRSDRATPCSSSTARLDRAAWPSLISKLPGFRSIVLERPGWGLSSAIDFSSQEYGTLVADVLREALDALELERAHVVGGSIGNVWALRLAGEHPSRVDRVVLMGGGPIVVRGRRSRNHQAPGVSCRRADGSHPDNRPGCARSFATRDTEQASTPGASRMSSSTGA